MARQRYTTTSPTFSNDFMYQAPWELAVNALQFNEKQVDNIFDQAQILGDATTNVNFLEADRGTVEAERKAIEGQVSELTEELSKDPTQWKKQMPKIKQLSQSIQGNLRTGNLSKVQGSYNAYQGFLKNYESLRKTDPQEFDKVANFYLNQWKNTNERGSLDSTFNPGAVYAPKALTDKEFTSILKDFKADESTTLEGLYKIDNKIVTKDQVVSTALNLATSNPDFANFIGQRQMIGDESYRTPMFLNVDAQTGQVIDAEEAQRRADAFSTRALEIEQILSDPNKRAQLSEQDMQALQAELNPTFSRQLNPNNAIAQQANALGDVYGFRSQKITGNAPAIAMYNQAQTNARQAQSIAATDRRQANQIAATAEQKDKDRQHSIELAKLKAESTPKKGSKATAKNTLPETTTGGNSTFPVWMGTTIFDDSNLVQGRTASGAIAAPFDVMKASTKVATITDASSKAALAKSPNRESRELLGFISNSLKTGSNNMAQLIAEGDSEAITEAYYSVINPEGTEQKNNVIESVLNVIGRGGSPGAPVRDADMSTYETQQNASKQFDTYYNKVRGAADTFVKTYTAKDEALRAPKGESDYFGINTKNPKVQALQNNMNVNIGEYQFYDSNDLITPITDVSDIKLLNITDAYGATPVGYIVKDAKGRTLKAIPNNSNRMQNDLNEISRYSGEIFSAQDTAKANLYFGNGGKNAKLASAFSYTSAVADDKQTIPLTTSVGKGASVTKEVIKRGGKELLEITISYPTGASGILQTTKQVVDPSTQSQAHINDALSKTLDEIQRKYNYTINY